MAPLSLVCAVVLPLPMADRASSCKVASHCGCTCFPVVPTCHFAVAALPATPGGLRITSNCIVHSTHPSGTDKEAVPHVGASWTVHKVALEGRLWQMVLNSKQGCMPPSEQPPSLAGSKLSTLHNALCSTTSMPLDFTYSWMLQPTGYPHAHRGVLSHGYVTSPRVQHCQQLRFTGRRELGATSVKLP